MRLGSRRHFIVDHCTHSRLDEDVVESSLMQSPRHHIDAACERMAAVQEDDALLANRTESAVEISDLRSNRQPHLLGQELQLLILLLLSHISEDTRIGY